MSLTGHGTAADYAPRAQNREARYSRVQTDVSRSLQAFVTARRPIKFFTKRLRDQLSVQVFGEFFKKAILHAADIAVTVVIGLAGLRDDVAATLNDNIVLFCDEARRRVRIASRKPREERPHEIVTYRLPTTIGPGPGRVADDGPGEVGRPQRRERSTVTLREFFKSCS